MLGRLETCRKNDSFFYPHSFLPEKEKKIEKD